MTLSARRQARGGPALTLLAVVLAALACSRVGGTPTLPPPPATDTVTPSPGPETPTPRPESLTQPVAASPTAGGVATQTGSPLPPLDGNAFTRVAGIGANSPDTILDLTFTPDGTLWLLTDVTVARLAADQWETYLEAFDGELVGVDVQHRAWVLAPDGTAISAWDGSAQLDFGAGEGWQPLPSDTAASWVRRGIAADLLGRIWLGTADDVRAFDGERWQVFDRDALGLPAPASGTTGTRFTVYTAPTNGRVWVAACDFAGTDPVGGGVRWLAGTEWHGADSPVANGCGMAFASSAFGPTWVGVGPAIFEHDAEGETWTELGAPPPPAGRRAGYVAGLAVDNSTRPWPLLALCGAAGCDSFALFVPADDGSWTSVGTVTPPTPDLLFDTSGAAWLLSTEGVVRVANGDARTAPDMVAQASAQDNAGQIYVVGERGGEVALWLVGPGE